jgi:polyisoprenoid-binding protein YceI
VGKIRQHRKGLIAGAVLMVAVLAIGVPWAYVNLVEGDQPAPLSVDAAPTASAGPTGGSSAAAEPVTNLDGAWTVGNGSQAGYRVEETLAGQSTTAVGRTGSVTGSVTVAGSSVSKAAISVDVGSIASDQPQRDRAFSGRIMEASQFPTATFTLARPIELRSAPAVGATVTADATGELTLHGVTQAVTFPVSVRRSAATVAVAGTIPIQYADYAIDNPSIGGFVSVGESGTVEFLLVLTKS